MAFLLGVLASFFFSVTFVLNQSMASSGGDWLWTASKISIYDAFLFYHCHLKKK